MDKNEKLELEQAINKKDITINELRQTIKDKDDAISDKYDKINMLNIQIVKSLRNKAILDDHNYIHSLIIYDYPNENGSKKYSSYNYDNFNDSKAFNSLKKVN